MPLGVTLQPPEFEIDPEEPVVFWLSVGNVQFVNVPEDGVPSAPPEVMYEPAGCLLLNVDQSVEVKYPFALALAAAIEMAGVVPPEDTTGAVPVTLVTVPEPLLLKVVQSAELNTPRLVADAVGTFSVITGVVVLLATDDERSVPDVPKVSAATEVTVPPPPLAEELIVWFGQVPVMVTLVPATKDGVAVPVPPDATAKIDDKPAAVPVVFWFNVGNVQFVKLPEDGVPNAPPEVR